MGCNALSDVDDLRINVPRACFAVSLTEPEKTMPVPQFIAGLSLAGKISLGVVVAAAAAGGAGAAGVLPDPMQHTVATSVDTVAPFTFPDNANSNSEFGNNTSTDAHDDTPGVDGTQVSTDAKATHGKPDAPSTPDTTGKPETAGDEASQHGIGATVSADATDGGVDGATVSDTAKAHAAASAQAGLDHAATTPAQDHVPTSLPPRPTR